MRHLLQQAYSISVPFLTWGEESHTYSTKHWSKWALLLCRPSDWKVTGNLNAICICKLAISIIYYISNHATTLGWLTKIHIPFRNRPCGPELCVIWAKVFWLQLKVEEKKERADKSCRDIVVKEKRGRLCHVYIGMGSSWEVGKRKGTNFRVSSSSSLNVMQGFGGTFLLHLC